jgi:hypothetical protein
VIHSDDAMGIQRLNQEAAKALAAGREAGIQISDDEALRWITANAAWTIGAAGRGRHARAGKRGDVVIWSGHPFSVYSRAEQVFVDGALLYDRNDPSRQYLTDFELGIFSGKEARDETHTMLAALLALAGWPLPAQNVIAIEGGTVHTMVGAPIQEGGTVLIRDGRIVAVGRTCGAGRRASHRRHRAHVTPGFIESGTQIGLVEVGAVAGSVDHTHDADADEVRDQIRAGFNIADGLNPQSTVIPVTRIAGITTAVSRPSGGLISGQGVVLDLDGRLVDADAGPLAGRHVRPRLGEGAPGDGWAARARDDHAAARGAGGRARLRPRPRNFDRGATREYAASRLDLEALQPVLNRQIPLVIEAHRASDIRRTRSASRATTTSG